MTNSWYVSNFFSVFPIFKLNTKYWILIVSLQKYSFRIHKCINICDLLYMQERGIFDSLCVLTGKCSWNISRLYISKWGLCQNDTFCQHFCESYSLLEEETKEGQQYVVVRLQCQMGSILTNNIAMEECHCILIDPDGFIRILYLARQFL